MHFRNNIFGELLKTIDRRQFDANVERFAADAYDKSFKPWDHLTVLIYAQLSQLDSLRAIETGFNASGWYHRLNVDRVARSTLADANERRPPVIFEQTFGQLASEADRRTRQEGTTMIRLIDASPIPLGDVCKSAKWNGRFRGMKLHLVYDPIGDVPRCIEITPANVNDIEIGRQAPIENGLTYVFDKGYYRFVWWQKINDCGAFFVTRPKTNMRLRATRFRPAEKAAGDGFTVIEDAEVRLVSKGDSRLPIPLRRIRVKRDTGGKLTLLTNDLERTAVEIAALYKLRWQIELLFRWIKQHLKIRKFLGTNENAIRLQILAAMIAYLLLRIAAHANRITVLPLRFAELVRHFLFSRLTLAEIGRAPLLTSRRHKPMRLLPKMRTCYV